MKRLLIISAFVSFISFITLELKSQTPAELLAKPWQFKMPTSINETTILGTPIPIPHSEIAGINYQFRIVNILPTGDLVIKFLYWGVALLKDKSGFAPTAATSPNATLNEHFYMQGFLVNYFSPNKANSFIYFVITRSEFDSRCEEKLYHWQFTVGAMSLPIKIRFAEKNSDGTNKSYSSFTGNLSLGISFGEKYNFNKWLALSLLTGFSLSSTPVSAETTNNFVQNETNQASLTWHAGLLLKMNNFQIGAFTGIDYLSGQINNKYVYKNKPWLGVGIGFSFFNERKTTDTQ